MILVSILQQKTASYAPGYGSPMRAIHPAPTASTPDPQTMRMLRELQNQVKQLQTENVTLKRNKFSSSVPDLSTVGTTSFAEPVRFI